MYRTIRPVLFIILSAIIYFSLLILFYHFEFEVPGSGVRNFVDVIWWSVATIATVGYGDIVPVTTEGRTIGYVFLFLSVTVYAYVIGKVSTSIKSHYNNKKLGFLGTNFTNHTVIIGWDDFGKKVVDQLIKANRKVAIVTEERNHVDQIYHLYSSKAVFVLFANCTNYKYFNKLNIAECNIVFLNNGTDTDNLVHLLNLKRHFPGLEYIVNVDNPDLKNNFYREGVKYVISGDELASKLMASYIFEPDVAFFNEEIIAFADSDDKYDVKQFKVLDRNPFLNREYSKVFFDLKREYRAILVGISREMNGKYVLKKNPADGTIILAGDYLLVIANRVVAEKLSKLFGVKEGVN